MRPIKFRAWTGKRMFYQAQQYLNSFIRRAVHYIIFDSGNTESEKEHESYLPNGGDIDQYLTQFTGLVDKNGKEIYEGDILEYKGIRGAVVFDNGSFTLDDPFKMGVVWMTKHDLKHSFNAFEIIGNTYENPELLKV